MTTVNPPFVQPVDPTRTATAVLTRGFYSFASLVLLALTLLGFYKFYLHGQAHPGRPLTPPIRGVLIAHGLVMSAWIVLAVVQPLLIAGRSKRAHRLFGRVGGVLAIAVVVLGVWVAIAATRVNPPDLTLFGLTGRQFTMVPMIAVTLFAVFVASGIVLRKQPAMHKPMMFLATLTAISASVGRIDVMNTPFAGTSFEYHLSAFTPVVLLGAALLGFKWAIDRRLDRWFAIGLAWMTVAFFVATHVARTALWDSFVQWLTA
jgi:hypothetical protein